MTLPYYPRLVCLALASFFMVLAAAAGVVSVCAPFAIRMAERFRPRVAARFLLILRMLPCGLALVAAFGLCVPSFLWFEPERFGEPVGLAFLCLAGLAVVVCACSAVRAIRAAIRSLRFARRCRQSGYEMPVAGQSPAAFVLEDSAPFLALTGIVRPHVVMSRGVVEALSAEELGVVLRHEDAHRASRDNLKRLFLFLVPAGSRALERAWTRYSEYAADEEAVGGDAPLALALASAMVRVARFGGMRAAATVATSFLGDAADLAARVERLLATPRPFASSRRASWFATASVLLAATCVVPLVFQPATFRFVQSVLERLIR